MLESVPQLQFNVTKRITPSHTIVAHSTDGSVGGFVRRRNNGDKEE